MINEFTATGGCRIGKMSASYPFVKLSVTASRLEINASIGGKYVFAPDDIISIEPVGGLTPGIKFIHKVANYSPNVIFSSRNNISVLQGINQAGFVPCKSTSPIDKLEIIQLQESGGFPLKVRSAMALVIIWNFLLIGGIIIFVTTGKNRVPTLPIQSAFGFIFLVALGMLVSQPFADIFLKPGRSVKDIKSFLLFMMVIFGMMFLLITIAPFNNIH